MTTHPAPDPFDFRSDLIRREPYTDSHGRRWIRIWYGLQMPGGGKIGKLIEPNDQHADRMAQRQFEATFRQQVDGLSAHQRMTWAAAAMADGVAP